jgi:peptidoglycan/xylan/chitin deacetylase (PgdA/CDA1 family)
VIAGSIGLHGLAGVGLLADPVTWPWVVGAIATNHALLAAAGLWPRSQWLGPNLTQLPEPARARREIAITIDDGPDPEVTVPTLELLDRRGVKATFFCIAAQARAHPDLCREIARRGHAVENHSSRHLATFSLLGVRGQRDEIRAAQDTLAELAGCAPRFFRPPAGLRNPLLDPILHDLGLRLASWTRRGFDTRTRDPARVAARVTRGLGAGDIVLLHDGNAARAADGRPVILEALARLLDAAEARGLKAVTLRHAVDP